MKTRFIRILSLTLTLALLLCSAVLPASAESIGGAAEKTVQKLTEAFGDPRSKEGPSTGNRLDVTGSRLVFVSKQDGKPTEIMIVIRVSDSQSYVFGAAYSEQNLDKAVMAFSEDAPVNLLAIRTDGDVTDLALALAGGEEGYTYAQFKTDCARIRGDLTGRVPGAKDSSTEINYESRTTGGYFDNHSLLRDFPGLRWGLTRDQMIERYGESAFINADTRDDDGEGTLAAAKNIGGTGVVVMFRFEGNKLNQIMIRTPEEKEQDYVDEYSALYGVPFKTRYIFALGGRLVEDPSGDCYAWKTTNTVILVSGRSVGVTYMSLY